MRAIDPDVQSAMAARAAGTLAPEDLPLEETRRAYLASRRMLQPPFDPLAETRDVQMFTTGGPLTLRVFRAAPDGRVLPCLLFMHGGGWVVGNLDSHEYICRRLAAQAECCVVSVDYRLAPEHPFPAAVEDSAAALRWVAAHAAEIGIDPYRIAVGGDSAGGNLAAVLTLMARNGTVPRSTFQLLLYPAIDLRMTGASFDTASPDLPVTSKSIRWFVDQYAPNPGDRDDWRASPLRAASLAGTPPAFVLTCGHDPLCDEGRLYAARLESEGVPVTALHLSSQAHGILTMGKLIGAVAGVLSFAATALADTWREERPP